MVLAESMIQIKYCKPKREMHGTPLQDFFRNPYAS